MRHFYQTVAFLEAGESPLLALPASMVELTAAVVPVAGQCAVEYTIDSPLLLQDDPGSVTWLVWTPGFVGAATAQALLSTVSGVRLVTNDAAGGKLILAGRY